MHRMSTYIQQLICLSDIYCSATGRTRSAVSKRVFNDGKILDKLAAGKDLTTGRHQMALHWFSDNWPDGTAWPAEIERPLPLTEAPENAA